MKERMKGKVMGAEKKPEKKKNVRLTKADTPKIATLVVYIVQARGEVSFMDLEQDLLERVGVTINRKTLSGVMEALRKREIFAERYRSGTRVYSMKKTIFNCRTEVAALEDITAWIAADSGAELIATWFADQKKEPKSTYPGAWVLYEAVIELLSPWLGQHPLDGSPVHMLNYERSPIKTRRAEVDPAKTFLTFERANGSVVINRACQRGFLRSQMRLAGRGAQSVDNFGITDWLIPAVDLFPGDEAEAKLDTICLPVQRHTNNPNEGTGCGMADYETIPVGTKLRWRFTAPTVNFLTPDEMKGLLTFGLEFVHGRSMSPGRGSQYGSARLLDLKVVAELPCFGRNAARQPSALELPIDGSSPDGDDGDDSGLNPMYHPDGCTQ